jgi:rhamnosyltransferase
LNKLLVILASYNGEKYIKEQLLSILNQIDVQLDILVFDDQSKDNTAEILKEMSNSYQNITFNINAEPSGSAAKNFCNSIKSISKEILNQYDFIALSDQDDIWLLNKLSIASQTLIRSDADLYASNLIMWQQDIGKKCLLKKDHNQKKYDFLFEGASAGCTYVFTSEFANHLKTKLFEINYENWLYFSHDWLIYFIARLDKFKVIIDSKAEILYRIHSDNVHGQLNISSFEAIRKRLDIILSGWYFKQSEGFSQLLNPTSKENEIYQLYRKNLFTRFWILVTLNFELIRSSRKFFKFSIVSIFPIIK